MMIFTIAKMDREDGPPSGSHFGNFRSDRVRVFGFPEPLRFQASGRTHETIRQVKIARICTNPGLGELDSACHRNVLATALTHQARQASKNFTGWP
jgi:hypothetical protein